MMNINWLGEAARMVGVEVHKGTRPGEPLGGEGAVVPITEPITSEAAKKRANLISATGVAEFLIGCTAMLPVYNFILSTIETIAKHQELTTNPTDIILPLVMAYVAYIAQSAGIEDIAIGEALNTAVEVVEERDTQGMIHELVVLSSSSEAHHLSIRT